ncbi:MAG: anthranilate phosphoribosyltransferase [Lentisphaeria bacterium]|nr:anthranilate phosphoribosyltransferase [Lentisphaeria bacterium]
MLKEELEKILAGSDLTAEETGAALEKIASGSVPPVQIGAFLGALRAKGESETELAGAARILRRKCRFIDCGTREVIDTCGTGGDRRDGRSTFNISTTCAFVAAGAGVAVAKHGNRSVSSKCGSADVLAELGYNLDAAPETVEDSIQDNGIGFLFAAKLHPVMGAVAPYRRELGVRTIFNMLGPLINPAHAGAQLLGVYDAKLTELFARVLRDLGLRRALVVHGHDGMDEITICAPTRISELKNGEIRTYDLHPEIYLDRTYRAEDIPGGDACENARILRAVLTGEDRGAARAITLLNSGAAILAAGLAEDLRDGIRQAEKSIDSGAGLEKLEVLIRSSKNG